MSPTKSILRQIPYDTPPFAILSLAKSYASSMVTIYGFSLLNLTAIPAEESDAEEPLPMSANSQSHDDIVAEDKLPFFKIKPPPDEGDLASIRTSKSFFLPS